MRKKKCRPAIQKPPAAEAWCVDVYEHEAGWMPRLEDHHEFPSREKAEQFARDANANFSQHGDNSNFALAHPPYPKQLKPEPSSH